MTEINAKLPLKCLVCAVPVANSHFGMDCCRACAMFFKRTSLSGMKYACGPCDGKCVISGEGEIRKCRRCRFDRCIAIGLVYDGPLRINNKPPADLIEKPSTSNSVTTNTQPRILHCIGQAFNASVDRRRAQEEMILSKLQGRKVIPHPTQILYLANRKNYMLAFNVCCVETMDFLRHAFPSLSQLSQQERDLLFKGYINKFIMIDSHHRTRSVWGKLRRYLMGSVMLCFDLEDADQWLEDEEGGEHRQALLATILSYVESQFEFLLPVFNKAQMTNHEFYALLALMLCDIDAIFDLSESTLNVLHEVRREVIDDLQRHYKEEMGLGDFSARLGNLITLNHSIHECNSLFQLIFRMQTTIFDSYESDELIKQLFM